jgi:hypothetical protein
MTAMSTDGKDGGIVKEYSRRDFFTSGSKDMLKDVVRAWSNFSEEKKKEETKLSCDEAAFKVFSRKSGNSFLKKNNKVSTLMKGGI